MAKTKAAAKPKAQSKVQRNVMFLAWTNSNQIQSFQWRLSSKDLICDYKNHGREFQMTEGLMHEMFDECIHHYQQTGKISQDVVYELVDMYVAAPEVMGTRPQIYQVHIFERRAMGVRLDV